MAFLQVAIARALRRASKVLNTAFGWATMLLFGQVPSDRQIYLSLISLASVVWLVFILGIAFPSFATFLLTFVSLPGWVDRTWIRLAMLASAVLLPAVVGLLS